MKQYADLVKHVLDTGTRKENRTGVDTISTFNYNYEVDLAHGFPLLTTKKINWTHIVIEMLWFLSGSANTDILRRHGCRIWEPWVDQWGHVGPVYGKQWRRWEVLHYNPPKTYEPPTVEKSHWRPKKVAGVGVYQRGDLETLPYAEMLYNTWSEMLYRCYDEKREHYQWYGAKGVHVDPKWFDFRTFIQDAQKLDGWHLKTVFPDQYQLDKDFNNSNRYGPDTCIWASLRENHLNTSQTKLVKVTRPDGKSFVTLDLTGVCSDYNLDKSSVCKVIRGERPDHKGWLFQEEVVPDEVRPRIRIHDQIADVLALLKTNPMSRRMVVSAWNPAEVPLMRLPPCHTMFVLNVQNEPIMTMRDAFESVLQSDFENAVDAVTGGPGGHKPNQYTQRLNLHLTQRSLDAGIGAPYNLASYALLLSIFAHLSGIKPGIFAHSIVDAHIYTKKPDGSMAEYDHIPGLEEQIKREPRALPKLIIDPAIKELSDIEALMRPEVTTDEVMRHFKLEGYNPHPAVPFKVAV